MPVILTILSVRTIKYAVEILIFVSTNVIWSVKSFSLTLFHYPDDLEWRIMTKPIVLDSNCVNYHPNPRTQCYSLDMAFCYMCTVNLILGQGHPWVIDKIIIVWGIIQILLISEKLYLDMNVGFMCAVTLNIEIRPLAKVITHPWDMDNNCVKYYLYNTRQ